MRIVLVSSGQVARQFAKELSADYDVTVVHSGEEGRSDLERYDCQLIDGQGNDIEVMKRAGAHRADWVIACSRSDELNLVTCLTTRQLGKAKTICFVGKEEYVRTFGAFGRLYLGGGEAEIEEAVKAIKCFQQSVQSL